MSFKFQDFLLKFILFSQRYSKSIFTLSIILFFVSIFFALKLNLKAGFVDLLSKDSPSVQTKKLFDKVYGEQGFFIVGLRGDINDFETLVSFEEALVKKAKETSLIRSEIHKLEQIIITKNPALFIQLKDLKDLRSRLEKSIQIENKNNDPFLIGPKEKNTFNLDDILSKYPNPNRFAKNGYLYDSNSNTIYVLFRPSGSSSDIVFTEKLNLDFYHMVDEIKKSDPKYKDITPIYGDLYHDLYEDRAKIKKDAKWLSTVAVVLLFLLLFYKYRGLKSIFIIFYPVLLGVIVNLAFTYFFIGDLNLVTGFLSMILMGTGLDFAIHLYGRYQRELIKSNDVKESLLKAFLKSGSPSVYAALTTIMGFYSLIFAKFGAFKDFGLIAGNGIIITSLCIIILLPSMVSFINVKKESLKSTKFYNFEPFFRKNHRLLLITYLAAMLLCAASVYFVQFDYEFINSRASDDQKNQRAMEQFDNNLDINSKSSIFLTKDKDTFEKSFLYFKKKIKDNAYTYIRDVYSLDSIIPDEQEEKLAELKKIKKLYEDNKVPIQQYLEKKGIKKEASYFLDFLYKTEKITPSDIPEGLLEIVKPRDPNYYSFIISAKHESFQDIRKQMQYVKEIKIDDPGIKQNYYIGGIFFILSEIVETVMSDTKKIMALLLGTLILLTFIAMRSWKITLLLLLHLITVALLMSGLLVLFNVKFTFLNLLTIPIIVGITVNSAIHLGHIIETNKNANAYSVLNSLYSPIMLSSITTVLGFFALFLSSYHGLVSLAQMATVGMGASIIASLFFTPLILPLLYKEKL